jgi:hypothetical protein
MKKWIFSTTNLYVTIELVSVLQRQFGLVAIVLYQVVSRSTIGTGLRLCSNRKVHALLTIKNFQYSSAKKSVDEEIAAWLYG